MWSSNVATTAQSAKFANLFIGYFPDFFFETSASVEAYTKIEFKGPTC